MKLYATFFLLWFLLIAMLSGYVWLYAATAQASALAFETVLPSRSRSAIEHDNAKLKSYVVVPEHLPFFMQDMRARIKAVGASAVMTTEPVIDSRFIRFVLSADGDFNSVMRAIGVIEYAPYVLSVDSVRAGVGERGAWNSQMTFSVGSQTAL